MKRRRVLITGVLLLLGGAIVNVAVAWGCSVWSPPKKFRHLKYPSTIAAEVIYGRCGYRGERVVESSFTSFGRVRTHFASDLQPWFADHEVTLERSGFPCHSLQGELIVSDYEVRLATALQVPGLNELVSQGPISVYTRFLPTAPLWPGFAINTIFYAAILWLLWTTPFVVRRRRRIKRGLCPACVYPVGTSPVCTECGMPNVATDRISTTT